MRSHETASDRSGASINSSCERLQPEPRRDPEPLLGLTTGEPPISSGPETRPTPTSSADNFLGRPQTGPQIGQAPGQSERRAQIKYLSSYDDPVARPTIVADWAHDRWSAGCRLDETHAPALLMQVVSAARIR